MVELTVYVSPELLSQELVTTELMCAGDVNGVVISTLNGMDLNMSEEYASIEEEFILRRVGPDTLKEFEINVEQERVGATVVEDPEIGEGQDPEDGEDEEDQYDSEEQYDYEEDEYDSEVDDYDYEEDEYDSEVDDYDYEEEQYSF